jgi:AAHS family 4-hydroxybenzoate transporter-like MFS transporter
VSSGSHPLTVSEFIDQRPMTRFQILTVGLCGVVFLLDGFDGTALEYPAPSISESAKIPSQTFGPLFSAGVFGLMIAVLTTGPSRTAGDTSGRSSARRYASACLRC